MCKCEETDRPEWLQPFKQGRREQEILLAQATSPELESLLGNVYAQAEVNCLGNQLRIVINCLVKKLTGYAAVGGLV